MKLLRLAAPLLFLLTVTACGRSDQRPANDVVSYTNRTSKTTTVTVYPPATVVGTTRTTSAALSVAEKERGPMTASAHPDISGRHPDRRMSDRIQKVLAADEALRDVALDRVRIVSVDGHVTLSGLVPTLADKVAIEQRVREVKGVEAVDNEIEVLR